VGLPLTITDQWGVIWHKVIICDIGAMDYSKRRFFISILSCNRHVGVFNGKTPTIGGFQVTPEGLEPST